MVIFPPFATTFLWQVVDAKWFSCFVGFFSLYYCIIVPNLLGYRQTRRLGSKVYYLLNILFLGGVLAMCVVYTFVNLLKK